MFGGAHHYSYQPLDANGNIYPLALLKHYEAGGGTTDKTIWSDEAMTTPLVGLSSRFINKTNTHNFNEIVL